MDQSAFYGQQDFNLPHDVVKLPSKGIFYKPRKESLKVGYLTAADENLLLSQNTPKEGLVTSLLRNKIYEPGFDVTQMIDVDVQAILLFLRNTSFGPEYNFRIIDPVTNKEFETVIKLDEIDYKSVSNLPDGDGYFTTTLPKTNKKVVCKLLNIKENNELDDLSKGYPQGMIAPNITKRLEKQVVEIDGEKDRAQISSFITQMPISDSKYLRKFLGDSEPKMDLTRIVTAPSGEKVPVEVTFGVEFFRPFFEL